MSTSYTDCVKRDVEPSPPPVSRPAATPDISWRLRRLLRRPAVQGFLHPLCQSTQSEMRLVGPDGATLLAFGDAAQQVGAREESKTVISYDGCHAADLMVSASPQAVGPLAAAITTWLEEQLRAETELDSLSQEVVHIYEELHLLYELGAALGGVLDVEAAGALIVRTLLEPMGAISATINLLPSGDVQVLARAERPVPCGAYSSTAARASAMLHGNAAQLGEIVLQGKIGGPEFTSDDLKLLDGVAAVAAPAIHNAQLYEIARRQADHDALTGTANHRCLQQRIGEEFVRAQRYNHGLSLIMIDLDEFKLFNAVYGHPTGDRVLQTVACCLGASVRSSDTVGRYGGDEFMLILPETDGPQALEVAERVLAEVAACEVVVNGQRLPIGLSLGIASYPLDATTKQELIAHADTALYESKNSGGGTASVAHLLRTDWLALQSTTYGVLEGLVHAVDTKDHYTRDHSEVVTEAALLLARNLNLSEETQRALRIAGLLHDVGKIGIPDHVLKKPGKLTAAEYEIMKSHVKLSELIIKDVPNLADVLDAVGHHHEHYDGGGYPHGKQHEQIPLVGRIMAVADAYSAMSMDRPYRKGLSWEETRAELVRGAGTQFDPRLAAVFIAAMDVQQGNVALPATEVRGAPEPHAPSEAATSGAQEQLHDDEQ